jgi:peptide chain release factor 1
MTVVNKKELLFSLTKADFRWDYYRGSGKGGQKRNKTENCCRCTHAPSGAVGRSEEGRSKEQNRKKAFRRMAESKKFMEWVRVEAARVTGDLAKIEARVNKAMREVTTEIRINDKWTKVDPDKLTNEPGAVRISDI